MVWDTEIPGESEDPAWHLSQAQWSAAYTGKHSWDRKFWLTQGWPWVLVGLEEKGLGQCQCWEGLERDSL